MTFAAVAPALAKKPIEIVITVKDYTTEKHVKNQEIVVTLWSQDPRYEPGEVYTTGPNGKIVIDNSLSTYTPGIEYYLWVDYDGSFVRGTDWYFIPNPQGNAHKTVYMNVGPLDVEGVDVTGVGDRINPEGNWFMYDYFDGCTVTQYFDLQAGDPADGVRIIGSYRVEYSGDGWYGIYYSMNQAIEIDGWLYKVVVVDEHLAHSDVMDFTGDPEVDDNADFGEYMAFIDDDGHFYVFAHFTVELAFTGRPYVEGVDVTGVGDRINPEGNWFMYNYFDGCTVTQYFDLQAGDPADGVRIIGSYRVEYSGDGWYGIYYSMDDTIEINGWIYHIAVTNEHLAHSDIMDFTGDPAIDDNANFGEYMAFIDDDGHFYVFAHFTIAFT
jgi:hypothetical protein